jgi:hypothetical protein
MGVFVAREFSQVRVVQHPEVDGLADSFGQAPLDNKGEVIARRDLA